MGNKELISIIIPTFNRGHILGETLNSILRQTYQNWECLVIDDGSTDYTVELMEFYCEKDSRIALLYRPRTIRKGANGCRNYGLNTCKGEFIQFMDSDDLISKDKLEEQVKLLRSKNADIATCKWGSFGVASKLQTKKKYRSFRSFRNPKNLLKYFGKYNEYLPLHAYLTSWSLVEKSGNWNEELLINQDGEFFTRVLLNAKKLVFSSKAAAYYRYSSEDRTSILTGEKKKKSMLKSWQLIQEHINARKFDAGKIYVENGKRNISGNSDNLNLHRSYSLFGFLKK